MNKILESLKQAKAIIQTTDYFIYRIYPFASDKKLLIKIFVELKKSITKCINSVLHYEYIYKRISLYKDPKENFKIFEKKVAKRYNFNEEEIKKIKKLFEIIEKHEKSSMEFIKDNNLVILGDNMEKEILNIDVAKDFLSLAKEIYNKISSKIN